MRLFIALALPQDLKASLAQNIEDLKARNLKARWTNTDNLHLTLAFLGECDKEEKEKVEEILQSLPFPACCLDLEQSALFKDILVLKARASSSLVEYVKALKEKLDQAGIHFDHKAFRPHITLARKFAYPNPDLVYDQTISFDQVSLFQSILKPEGPEYIALCIIKARKSD